MTGRTSLAIVGFKWGNGPAVQAPNKLVEEMGLNPVGRIGRGGRGEGRDLGDQGRATPQIGRLRSGLVW